MPARSRTPFGAPALALAALVAGAVALAQPPDPPDPPKAPAPKGAGEPKGGAVRLPDGTLLWLGPGPDGARVTLTADEFQKLVERAEALKKELAARKPVAPSACAVRGRVEKRGEQLVAALRLTYSFRTARPNAAVALGGRRAFLVSAALDGARLPVLETGDDGFAVSVDAPGEHTLVLDAEAPVTARGAQAEVGFDLGLPKSPITTLALEPPPGDVKRVALVTRAPDPGGAKAADPRRLPNLDVRQLAPRDGAAGFPLGPVEALEVTWDPPAGGAAAADLVRAAEIDVTAALSPTDPTADVTARFKLRGPAREWRLATPPGADLVPERAAPGEVGPTLRPVLTKPADPAKPVWTVELPAGARADDWVLVATVRQPAPKAGPRGAGTPIGPFAALDVFRQTGTVRVSAGPFARVAARHGPELRRTEAPAGADDDTGTALFRLATGPTGGAPPAGPLLAVEAFALEGAVRVSPTYKLKLTEAGWTVRAELAVRPVRTEVAALALEVPAGWRGLASDSDQEVVADPPGAGGEWRPFTVRLAAPQRKPFAVALVATVPVPPGARAAALPLLRFPKALERDATATATVPEGLVLAGTASGWDGARPAAFGEPLVPVPGPDGKVPRAVTAATAAGDRGLARLALAWEPFRPDLTADVRAEVTVGERQLVVAQVVRLRAPDGFPKPVRFRGPPEALGLKPALESPGPGAWLFAPAPEAREAVARLTYALPLPAPTDGPASVPVGLFWPADATGTEATVRVWLASGRTAGAPGPGWREVPPEPAPEREALPALTLAAAGERPLTLELRPAPGGAAALWVDRALVEAAMTDDGSVAYRARFRLLRWLVPAAELELPEGAPGPPAVRLDGAAAPAVPVPGAPARVRVPLPEGAPGRAAVLDVQYAVAGTRHALGETVYRPARLAGATFAGPVRWLITEPGTAAPLVLAPNGRAEVRWRWRGLGPAPAGVARAAADRWFVSGTEPGPADAAPGTDGEPVLVRQAAPHEVRVARVPWAALAAAAALAGAALVLALAAVPAPAAGAGLTLLGGAFAVLSVLYPQPAAQLAGAAVPGAAAGGLAVLARAALRWRRAGAGRRLPGFARPPAAAAPTGSAPAPPAPSAAPGRGSSQAAAPSGT